MNKIKQLLLENIGLKIISLIVAIALWLMAKTSL